MYGIGPPLVSKIPEVVSKIRRSENFRYFSSFAYTLKLIVEQKKRQWILSTAQGYLSKIQIAR